jgi:hypothetical protein
MKAREANTVERRVSDLGIKEEEKKEEQGIDESKHF